MATVAKVELVKILLRWASFCNSTLLSTEQNTKEKQYFSQKKPYHWRKKGFTYSHSQDLCPPLTIGLLGGCSKGYSVNYHTSLWITDAIFLVYEVLGMASPLGVRAHSTQSIASSKALSKIPETVPSQEESGHTSTLCARFSFGF